MVYASTAWSTLNILTHSFPVVIPWDRCCYNFHSLDEETEAQRVSETCSIKQLVSGRSGTWPHIGANQ